MGAPGSEVDVVAERSDEGGVFVDLDNRVATHGVLGAVDPETVDSFDVPAAGGIGLADDVPLHPLRTLDDRAQQPGDPSGAVHRGVRNILVRRFERETRRSTRNVAGFDRIEEPTHGGSGAHD